MGFIRNATLTALLTLSAASGVAALLTGCEEQKQDKTTIENKLQEISFKEYPYFLTNQNGQLTAYLVVGDNSPASDVVAAVDVGLGLQEKLGQLPSNYIKLASEISTEEQNLILVGRDSTYSATPQEANPWLNYHTNNIPQLNPAEGYLAIEKIGDNYHIIVSGYDAIDVRKAGRALHEHLDELSGKKVIVRGTSLTDLTFEVLE